MEQEVPNSGREEGREEQQDPAPLPLPCGSLRWQGQVLLIFIEQPCSGSVREI